MYRVEKSETNERERMETVGIHNNMHSATLDDVYNIIVRGRAEKRVPDQTEP